LHKNLSLGHSNGWIETRESLLNSLKDSTVTYTEFKQRAPIEITDETEDRMILRRMLTATGKYKGEDFSADLNILEIWVKEHERWQLLARQSVAVNFDN